VALVAVGDEIKPGMSAAVDNDSARVDAFVQPKLGQGLAESIGADAGEIGGVGAKPWRARRAEHSLLGQPATTASFADAAGQELAMATPRPMNAFKVELAKRAIMRSLTTLTNETAP